MEDVYELRFPLRVYYRGAFGYMTKEQNEQNWSKEQKEITKLPIKDSQQLFQMFNILPTFEEVQVGFTYFFFKSDVAPDWDRNLNAFQLEALAEVTDEYAKFKQAQWKALKAQIEACLQMFILAWAGNSSNAFHSVIGITAKIRRARVTFAFWYSEEADGELLKNAVEQIFSQIDYADSAAKCKFTITSLRYYQEVSSTHSSRASSRNSEQRRGSSAQRNWGGDRQFQRK